MDANTNTASRSEFGPDDIELLNRRLAERGFHVLGCLSPASRTSSRSSRPDSDRTLNNGR